MVGGWSGPVWPGEAQVQRRGQEEGERHTGTNTTDKGVPRARHGIVLKGGRGGEEIGGLER